MSVETVTNDREVIKVGDATSTGQEISSVLGQSSRCAVFTTSDNQLRWQYFHNNGELPSALRPILRQFDHIMGEIKTFVPKPHRHDQYIFLGKSLFNALDDPTNLDEDLVFKDVKEQNELLAEQNCRLLYIASCFITFIILLIALLSTASLINPLSMWSSILAAGVFGSAGAVFSVLYRIKSIEIEKKSSLKAIAAVAAAHVGVGCFFGMFFVMASKSNIVLGAIRDNEYALYVFSSIAGFSERFVPELIEKLQSRPPS